MSDCTHIQEQLQSHLDNMPDAELPDAVSRHAAACEDCALVLSQLLQLDRALRSNANSESEQVLPSGFHANLMSRLQLESQQQLAASETWRRMAKWVLLPAAAASILAVATNPGLFEQESAHPHQEFTLSVPTLSLNLNLEPLKETGAEFESVGRSFLGTAGSAARALDTER